MRALVGALALSLIALPALADPPQGELLNSPGAAAQELIAAANAEGVFEAVTAEPPMIAVAHARSGMECRLAVDAENRLVLFEQAARGEDVACDSRGDRHWITLYATRYPFETTLEDQIEGATAAIHSRFADAAPYPSTMDVISEGLPANRTAEFFVTHDGVRHFTSVSVAQLGEWTLKQRFTAPAPDDASARQAELFAAVSFAAALTRMLERREAQAGTH